MGLVQLRGGEAHNHTRRLEEALAQASLCRALAAAFRPPTEALAGELSGLAALIPGDAGVQIRALADQVSEDLEPLYHRIFGAGGACPACESDHLPWRTVGGKGALLGDVTGFYRAFAFNPGAEIAESPDHLSIELSFAGWLWMKEANALHEGRTEEAELCRKASVSFADEHFAPWLERFCGRALEVADGTFYGEAVRALAERFEAPSQGAPETSGGPDAVALSGLPIDDLSGAPITPEGLLDPADPPPLSATERPITHGLSAEHRIVERVLDRADAAARAHDLPGLLGLLRFFDEQMPKHRQKEEEVLFPALAEIPALRHGPVRAMLLEHEEEARLLLALRRHLEEPTLDWEPIGRLVDGLGLLLRTHIEKEDQVLYALAEQVLAGPPALSIGEAFEAIGSVTRPD